MSLLALSQPRNILGSEPYRHTNQSWWDLSGAAATYQIYNMNSDSSVTAMREAITKNRELYEELTGESINSTWAGDRRAARVTSRRQELEDQRILELREEDPERFAELKTHQELSEVARQIALKKGEIYQQLSAGHEGGFSKYSAMFLGSMAGGVSDPIQLATLPIGASYGLGKGLLSFAAKESLIAMGTETLLQPAIMDWQKELGNEYGVSDAVQNIALAGAFGGLAAGVLAAPAKLSDRLFQASLEARRSDVRQAFGELSEAAKAAENVSSVDVQRHQINESATLSAAQDSRMPTVDDLSIRVLDKNNGIVKEGFEFLNPDNKFEFTTVAKDPVSGKEISIKTSKSVRSMNKSEIESVVKSKLLPDIGKDLEDSIALMSREIDAVPLGDLNSAKAKIKDSQTKFEASAKKIDAEIKSLKEAYKNASMKKKPEVQAKISSKEAQMAALKSNYLSRSDKLQQAYSNIVKRKEKSDLRSDFEKALTEVNQGKLPTGDSSPATDIRSLIDRVVEGAVANKKASKKRKQAVKEELEDLGINDREQMSPRVANDMLDDLEKNYENNIVAMSDEMAAYANELVEIDGAMVTVKSLLDETDDAELTALKACAIGGGQ